MTLIKYIKKVGVFACFFLYIGFRKEKDIAKPFLAMLAPKGPSQFTSRRATKIHVVSSSVFRILLSKTTNSIPEPFFYFYMTNPNYSEFSFLYIYIYTPF